MTQLHPICQACQTETGKAMQDGAFYERARIRAEVVRLRDEMHLNWTSSTNEHGIAHWKALEDAYNRVLSLLDGEVSG